MSKRLESLIENEDQCSINQKIGLLSIPSQKSEDILSNMKTLLFFNEGFTYEKNDFSFYDFLSSKSGDCLYFSMLYHLILERKGITNGIVSARSHTLIKSPLFNNFFLEPTEGILVKPQKYINERNIHSESIKKGIYLTNLNDEDVFSIYLNKKSKPFIKNRDYKNAEKFLERALTYSEKVPETYYNLGIISRRRGLLKKAKELFDEVISLDINFSEAYNNLALCYLQEGEDDVARDLFQISSNFGLPEARHNLEILSAC